MATPLLSVKRSGLAIWLAVTPGLLGSTTSIPATTPQGALLQDIAKGSRDSDTFRKHLMACVRGWGTAGCERKVALVLQRAAEEDRELELEINALLREAADNAASRAERERLTEMEMALRARSGRSEAANSMQALATLPHKLSREEAAAYDSSYVVVRRVQEIVRSEIGGDPATMARRSLGAALKGDCTAVLEGRLHPLCESLPAGAVQNALLANGVSPIWEGIGDIDLAELYGSMGSARLEQIAQAILASGNQALLGYDRLLRKWARHGPTKWQAWADAAALIGW